MQPIPRLRRRLAHFGTDTERRRRHGDTLPMASRRNGIVEVSLRNGVLPKGPVAGAQQRPRALHGPVAMKPG